MNTSNVLRNTVSWVATGCAALCWITASAYASEPLHTTLYDLNKTVSVAGAGIEEAVTLEDNIYFLATVGSRDASLWRYDKAAQQEYQVALPQINPNSRLSHLFVAHEQLYFAANTPSLNGAAGEAAMWRYDEDCRCAQQVGRVFNSISEVVSIGTKLLMVASSNTYGSELWLFDPQSGNTSLVADFNSGDAGSDIGNILVSDNKLYFMATNQWGIRKVWSYEVTSDKLTQYSAITEQLVQEGIYFNAHILAAKDDMLAVELERHARNYPAQGTPGSQLWLLDTASKSARKIDDINHYGKCHSDGVFDSFFPTQVAFGDNSLYYLGNSDFTSDHVWRYEFGNQTITNVSGDALGEFNYNQSCYILGVSRFHAHGDDLYFARTDYDGDSSGLWNFDAEHHTIQKLDSLSSIQQVNQSEEFLYFRGWDRYTGTILKALDFANNNISVVTNARGFPITDAEFLSLEDTPLVAATSPSWGEQLWQIDNSLNAQRLTTIAGDNTHSNPGSKMVLGDRLYFVAKSEIPGRKLWYVDSVGVPKLLPFGVPDSFGEYYETKLEVVVGEHLYFSIDNGTTKGFWRLRAFDNAITELTSLSDITDEPMEFMATLDGQMYFNTRVSRFADYTNSRLLAYSPDSDSAELVYDGDGKFLYLLDRSAFLYRNLDSDDGSQRNKELWRLDLDANTAQGSAEQDFHNQEPELLRSHLQGRNLQGGKPQGSAFSFGEMSNVGESFHGMNHSTTSSQDERLVQLEQASGNLNCRTYAGDDDRAVEAAGYLYFFRDGQLLRVDPRNDQLTDLSCVTDMFSLYDELYYLVRETNTRRNTLMRLPAGADSGQAVSEQSIDTYQVQNNRLYFMSTGQDGNQTLWQFDPQLGQEQFIASFTDSQVYLGQVYSVEQQDFVLMISGDHNQTTHRLWQVDTQTPVFEFSEQGVSFERHTIENWQSFAGDLWITGNKNQQGVEIQGELIRLHLGSSAQTQAVPFDFDGDGKADPAFRDKEAKLWTVFTSSDQLVTETQFALQEQDIPVSADYDGDGVFDLAFRRPGNQNWVVINSSGSNYNSDKMDGVQRIRFGMAQEDIPVSADYDGDGIADFAVRRPSFGGWIIRQSSNEKIAQITFGDQATDIPVVGDFDGDGKADLAFRRPEDKTWYVKNSSRSNYNSDRQDGVQRIPFGLMDEDIPVVADYDGDGITDVAVWRPSASRFIVRHSRTSEVQLTLFNNAHNALPVSADYDGDGVSDTAVYRPDTGVLEVKYFVLKKEKQTQFNLAPDVFPVAQPITQLMQQVSD